MRTGKITLLLFISLLLFLPPLAATAREKSSSRAVTNRQAIMKIAKKYIGTPYRFGGESPSGFDCSGFTKYVFKKAGYSLPHSAGRQYRMLKSVKKPGIGDLVFFKTYRPTVSHVGIYAGNNRFLHSPRTGKTVEYAKMNMRYWRKRYAGARTVLSGGSVQKKPTKGGKGGKKELDQDLLDFEMLSAVFAKDQTRFRKYLDLGANPSASYKGWSALMFAVEFNQRTMVLKLLRKGAKVNYRGVQGWTALALADYNKNKALIRILTDAGANRFRSTGAKQRRPNILRERF